MKKLNKTISLIIMVITTGIVHIDSGFPENIAVPVINEVMSSNSTTVQDEDGDSPDWIELYNPGTIPVDLTGYGLSDREDNPFKWVFPQYILKAGEYKIIFASGKDRTDIPTHWETVINQGDTWRYFVGVSEPPEDWKSNGFDDTGWQSGPSGFGFGDDDDATIIPQTISVYIRTSFDVDDFENIAYGLLHIDYDDAFVAYINGTEIARSKMQGEVGVPPTYDEVADPFNREALMYKGGDPEAYKIENLQSLLVTGENVIAIQVHNRTAISPVMTAIPFFTLGMLRPPANPSGTPDILLSSIDILVYLHTNFKINASGEALVLADRTGTVIDQVDTGYIPAEYSRGRQPDGGEKWVLFNQPTPGESNSTTGFHDFAAPVQASLPGGFYNDSISIELTVDSPTAVIHYTLDGNDPSEDSPEYTGSFPIENTTVVRARSFEEGYLPGRITTHTYFINDESVLTVISLSTPPANLWDPEIGIYVMGNNPGPYPWYYGANYWKEWEKPVHVEFYEPDGHLGFSMDASLKTFGGASRTLPQKSLSIFARGRYGYSEIKYQIFPDLPITEFKSILLRNSGNDWISTLFRDAMMQSLVKDTAIDTQGYRPAVVYINGAYWGIHNIREKQNEDYLASHHGVDPDNVDILRSNYRTDRFEIIEGDDEHYNVITAYMATHDMSVSDNYEYVKTQIDVNNFLDYMVAEIYYANSDWPGSNSKYWRPRTPGGKWRCLLFDTECGFGLWPDRAEVTHNTLEYATDPLGTGRANPTWSTFLFRKLLEHQSFRNDLINRFSDHFNTIFSSDFVIQRIREMKEVIEPEMPNHITRWRKSERSIGSMNYWYKNIQSLETFASKRVKIVRGHIIKKFNLIGTTMIDLNVSQSDAGKIKINTLIIKEYPWKGTYFKDIPVQLTALPNPGYRFTGWTGVTPIDSVSVSINLTENMVMTANFEPASGSSKPIVINEINYNSLDDFNPEDWVELYNSESEPVDLSGWVFKDEDDTHAFVFPDNTLIDSDSYLVLCRNASLFQEVFPDVTTFLGDLGFGLSGAGELLRLFNAQGALVDSITYDDNPPWPEEPDGNGPTLTLRNPDLDNTLPVNWSASSHHGTPGAKNDVYIVSVDENLSDHPAEFSLGQNYPNPFNQTTTIPFYVPEASRVTVEIYSILGQRVAKILDVYMTPGHHSVIYKANDLAGGLFLYTVIAGNFLKTKQMMFVK